MSWVPRAYFLSPQEFFGALIPGAVGTAIGFAVLRKSTLAPSFLDLSQPAQWAAFVVCALVLGLLAYPLGTPLDKLYDRVYASPRRRRGDPLLQNAILLAERDVPGISTSKESVYEWAKRRVEAKDPTLPEERGRLQGISKMFRTLCIVFFAGAVFLWIQAAALWATLTTAAVFLSFLLFCQLRWQATNLVYQRLRELTAGAAGAARIIVP